MFGLKRECICLGVEKIEGLPSIYIYNISRKMECIVWILEVMFSFSKSFFAKCSGFTSYFGSWRKWYFSKSYLAKWSGFAPLFGLSYEGHVIFLNLTSLRVVDLHRSLDYGGTFCSSKSYLAKWSGFAS